MVVKPVTILTQQMEMAVLLFALLRHLITVREHLVHAYLAFNIVFHVLMELHVIIAHL